MYSLFNSVVELIRGMPTPFEFISLLGVIAIVMGGISGIVLGIASQISKYVSLRESVEFKRELLDRGLEIDEIERLVAAQSPQDEE